MMVLSGLEEIDWTVLSEELGEFIFAIAESAATSDESIRTIHTLPVLAKRMRLVALSPGSPA